MTANSQRLTAAWFDGSIDFVDTDRWSCLTYWANGSRLMAHFSSLKLLVAILLWPVMLCAQGLPVLHPLNPVAESRTGLYFQPYRDPHPGWVRSVSLDYGSMLEINFRNSLADTSLLVDAEVMRVNLVLSRDLGPSDFLTIEEFVGGSYNGFLDGFLNWYHGLFGIGFPEREDRPVNRFDYIVEPSGGPRLRRRASGAYLGDLRVGLGHRYDGRIQTHLSVTLPTTTASTGYGRGTVSVNLTHTFRVPITPRLTYEGSLGTGFTPRHGDLAGHQERLFLMLTSGARYRFLGRLSAFANFFYHTPYYRNTGDWSLDRKELTLDFGWVLRTRNGHEWRIGMTEDPWPSGPAIDLSFRLGTSW